MTATTTFSPAVFTIFFYSGDSREEIISKQRIPETSEHEDFFVWRGLARVLYEHGLVV